QRRSPEAVVTCTESAKFTGCSRPRRWSSQAWCCRSELTGLAMSFSSGRTSPSCSRRHGRNETMKPAPFEYHAPRTLSEAVSLLRDLGEDTKVLAGGQSLVPMMALRLARFDHLVDLNR